MSLLKQLASSNYISVNKSLIKIFGLEEAVILGELCSEYEYWKAENKLVDDMFFCSVKKLEENTGLSDYQQRSAIKSLENAGVLITQLKGLPATRYFFIDENKLFNYLGTSSQKTKELDIKKLKPSNNISISKDIDINKNKNNNDNKIRWFLDRYHFICTNLPKVKAVTEKRKKAILQLMSVYSKKDIETVFTLANESDFLIGKNDRGWKADMDFILRNDKFVSILEGKYGGKKKVRNVREDIEHLPEVERTTKEEKEEFRRKIADGEAQKF